MRKALVIAKREYLASVRTKAFLISLVLMPVLMGGGAIGHSLLEGRVDLEEKRVVVSDGTGRLLPALLLAAQERNAKEIFNPQDGRQVEAKLALEPGPPILDDEQRLALSERIRRRQIHGFVEIGAGVLEGAPGKKPEARFHSESAGTRTLNRWFGRTLNGAVQVLRLRDAGLDPALVARATAPVGVESLGLFTRGEGGAVKSGDERSRTTAFLLPFGVMMLMFMTLLASQTMLHSTLEEKQQRIAEVLLGSARPFDLMLGKLLGNAAVSLTTVLVYLLGSVALLNHYGQAELLRNEVVGWFLVYQVLGVVMFGSIFVAVGAACNEIKDAQSYLLPVIMVLVLPMMIWFRLLEEPMSRFATTLSLVPVWSPMLMPMRMATTAAVPLWQPVAGAIGTVIAAMVCVWAGGRIFRVGMLLQGKPPRLSQLARWVLRG
jgi:ABC-2 type transport system permease protein